MATTTDFRSKSNSNCCVPGCKSVRKNAPHLTYHGFPKSGDKIHIPHGTSKQLEPVERLQLWMVKLRMGKKATKTMKVCSLHFHEDDYEQSGAWNIRKRLKPTAVPSRNLPESDKIRRLKRRTYPTQKLPTSPLAMATTSTANLGRQERLEKRRKKEDLDLHLQLEMETEECMADEQPTADEMIAIDGKIIDRNELKKPKTPAERMKAYRARKKSEKPEKAKPKTSTERVKAYRARKKIGNPEKAKPKTSAERVKAYRERKQQQLELNQSAKKQKSNIVNTPQRTLQPRNTDAQTKNGLEAAEDNTSALVKVENTEEYETYICNTEDWDSNSVDPLSVVVKQEIEIKEEHIPEFEETFGEMRTKEIEIKKEHLLDSEENTYGTQATDEIDVFLEFVGTQLRNIAKKEVLQETILDIQRILEEARNR